MSNLPGFTTDLFDFLSDLAENNDREWFQINKRRYEESVKEPALVFIAAFGPYLNNVSTHFQAIPRAQGGSLFRIYRDTRFGKDKSPYKTNTGLHFRHEAGKDAHAPGFYVHLAPGDVFFGAGLWRPESTTARAIRQLIVDEPDEWKKVKTAIGKSTLALTGDSLVRPPRGFDAENPFIDDLKRKDYLASVELNEKAALEPDFLEKTADLCKQAAPLVRFLCKAVDVPF